MRLGAPIVYKDVAPVLALRCYACHGPAVQMKNLRLDSAASVQQHAALLYQMAVVKRLMPFNNATGMTEAERALLQRWYEGGALMD